MPLYKRLTQFLAAFGRIPLPLRCGLVVVLTALIAYLDLATPPYIYLVGFYFLPIFLAVWYCPRPVAVLVIGMAVSTSLYVTNLLVPHSAPFHGSILALLSVVAVYLSWTLLLASLKVTFLKLVEESETDALTGLRSRRSFIQHAEFELSRSLRSGDPVVVAVLDIDNFKCVNDTQGHAVGDALLVAVSRCLKSTLREIDLIGRLGGDEFAIVLPGTPHGDGSAVLNRLLANLRAALQAFDPRVAASIGAVIVPGGRGGRLHDVLERADAAMYQIKGTSKDGVRITTL